MPHLDSLVYLFSAFKKISLHHHYKDKDNHQGKGHVYSQYFMQATFCYE